MRCFAVVTLRRADWTEAIVSLQKTEEGAQAVAQQMMTAKSHKFVRCRIRPMDLTKGQVEAICFRWGQADFEAGEPLRAERLPKPYDAAYRQGFRAAQEEARRGKNA